MGIHKAGALFETLDADIPAPCIAEWALMAFGVSAGWPAASAPAMPATCGAAMLVPAQAQILWRAFTPLTRAAGRVLKNMLPATASETVPRQAHNIGFGPNRDTSDTRTECRDGVIASDGRAIGLEAADGEHPGRVARRTDAAVLKLAGRGSCRGCRPRRHEDACVDDTFGPPAWSGSVQSTP